MQETIGNAAPYSAGWYRGVATTSILNLVAVFGLLGGAYRLRESFIAREHGAVAAKIGALGVALTCVFHNVSVTGQFHMSGLAEQRSGVTSERENKIRWSNELKASQSSREALERRIAALETAEAEILSKTDDRGFQVYAGRRPRDFSDDATLVAELRSMRSFAVISGDAKADNPRDTARLRAEGADFAALERIAGELIEKRTSLRETQSKISELDDQLASVSHIDASQGTDEILRTEDKSTIDARENVALQLLGYFGLLAVSVMAGGRRRDTDFIFEDEESGAPLMRISREGRVDVFVYDERGAMTEVHTAEIDPELAGNVFDQKGQPEPTDVGLIINEINRRLEPGPDGRKAVVSLARSGAVQADFTPPKRSGPPKLVR